MNGYGDNPETQIGIDKIDKRREKKNQGVRFMERK